MKKLILLLGLLAGSALADPCGMVPPISLDGEDSQITRVGEQKTYVFYQDGIETIAIHPGFEGNVDEFGMLIPFPTPPALRKISDHTFPHIEKALDPPVIQYWVRRPMPKRASRSKSGGGAAPATRSLARTEVKVLNKEAVGMYEVAVLEAGSASALKGWMDDHGFRFPAGMESTCNDYIGQRWCFVAVKTRVGNKSNVDPRPGMRQASVSKPKGTPFKGKVQAMGFRFRSPKLEVPMRLSAFNGGNFHNIVYLVADRPMRASNLPLELTKRQISGERLYKNLTEPLPYKIQGGTEDDMSPNDWKRLNAQRNPEPHNGAAADLLAADLYTIAQGELSHRSEEQEKALLDIGERLNLRGGRLDSFHDKELTQARAEMRKEALASLRKMHLTLVDGEFPAEVLATQNIQFRPYKLEAHREEWLLCVEAPR